MKRPALLLLAATLAPTTATAQRATAADHRSPRASFDNTAGAAHVARYGHSGLAHVITHGDSVAVIAFVRALQAAVARDDRRAVTRMVHYPAAVWDGRRSRVVRNASAFAAVYARVFSPSLRRDIAAVTVDGLFANWQGVMLASGHVWFDRNQAGWFGILTVNPPIGVALSRQRRAP
jgi:hypothetical protein